MDIFSFIKKNVSIETVAAEYTTLKRVGNYLKARCPFHNEKTASFTISPGKEIFYCFGCHQGGDVIMFISQLEKCSQRDAVLFLAERYNIALPEHNEMQQNVPREKKDRYFFIHQTVSQFFTDRYEKSTEAQKYVASRGITEEMRNYFSIGYFPQGKNVIQDFIAYAHKHSILTKELIEAHIIVPSESFYYSPFEGRIIIPIKEALGRICGFGGRTFKEDDIRVKYYNSHENEFFTKGTVLFGLAEAKEHIRQKKSVFVVEGYMDCILMVQSGYKNTVATLGTACTESHLKQLARYSELLYMIYDGDNAGKNALLRVAEKCWQVNIEPMVLSLPTNEDPASYLVKNKTLDKILETKMDIFSFCISFYTTSLKEKSLSEKMNAVQAVLSLLSSIDDPIKQNLLISQASVSLSIDQETLKKELKKTEKKQQKFNVLNTAVNNVIHSDSSNQKKTAQHDIFSRRILGMMLSSIQLLDPILVDLCLFSNDNEVCLVARKISGYGKNYDKNSYNFEALWHFFSDEERKLASLFMTQIDHDIDETTFHQLAPQFERHMLKKGIYYFKVQLAQAMQENNREKTEVLLQQLVAMQKKFKRETSIS